MRGRSGLLIALLVMVSGTGVEAQSTSPETVPWSTPDDLATTLPSSVGEYQVLVDLPPAHMERFLEGWQSVPMPEGKDLSDVHAVRGEGFPAGEEPIDRDRPAFTIWVAQVDGVPATEMLEPVVDAVVDSMPEELQAIIQTQRQTIEGRDVYAILWPELLEMVDGGNPESGIYHYPKSELLFQIMLPPYHATGSPPIAEILASLP